MPLDIQAREFIDANALQSDPLLPTNDAVLITRKNIASMARQYGVVPDAWVQTRDLRAKSPSGDIAVRMYAPLGKGPWPVALFFHGGGWVAGDLDTDHTMCHFLAQRARCIVVSVDYRLAPEHKFPAAAEDCYFALNWLVANAEKLDVDPRRIAVIGESAGANLAAVVCLMARDRQGPEITLQVLIYPSTTFVHEFDSHHANHEGYFLTRSDVRWFADLYIDNEDRANPYASPLMAPDFRYLPNALIITAEYDPLRDEGAMYARKLRQAHVDVQYICYSGMIHGFVTFAGYFDKGRKALGEVADAIGGALTPS